ncbi:MAG: hypothetical protein WC376_02420 [Candidatus Nanoarchaeia archaeon]|jgi:hypothetical protein
MVTEEEMKNIESMEYKYLKKFYHFLKYTEDEMLFGFNTKEKIKEDWIRFWDPEEEGKGISGFATGAERIVYSLFNGKGIGQPNSSPVGSDLFFETNDAFVHIDLKTVQTRNIGDFNKSIFVGRNQNSYTGKMLVNKTQEREYVSALPHYYKNNGNKKICLTFFVTILYEETNLKILNINILCMPNGALYSHYGARVLKAGKNPDKTRFNFSEVSNFEKLDGDKKRIKVVYYDESTLSASEKKKMEFIKSIYDNQM